MPTWVCASTTPGEAELAARVEDRPREGRVDGGLDPREAAVRDAQVTGLDRVVTRPHEAHVLDEEIGAGRMESRGFYRAGAGPCVDRVGGGC